MASFHSGIILALITNSSLTLLSGATISFVTSPDSVIDDGAVAAGASFTIIPGTLKITLQDLLPNPRNEDQLVGGLEFFMSGVRGGSTLSSSSADRIAVNSRGGVMDYGISPAAWDFESLGPWMILSAPGQREIIGPGPYTNANGSIAGSKQESPFLNQTAAFTILNRSITANSTVQGVVFWFGGDDWKVGVRQDPGPAGDPVPEPRGCVLLAEGLLGFGWLIKLGLLRAL